MTIFQAIPFTSEENPNGAPYGDFWEARVDQREGRVYWQTNFKQPEHEKHFSNTTHPRQPIHHQLAKYQSILWLGDMPFLVCNVGVRKDPEKGTEWFWCIELERLGKLEKGGKK